MRLKYRSLLLVLIVWASSLAYAQNSQLFKPFTFLRVIKTERFDIIFPKESEASANLLASYADSVYEQMSALLGLEIHKRIPVTLAPHTDLFNGFYNPVTTPHIVLYDTPMDLEWTSFTDNLKVLFIHELAHALTLNSRGGAWPWLYRVFGTWATPALFNAPYFMIEGVAISMESLNGFGRAKDPLFKQRLSQAIHEGKFPTPFQASGLYDLPAQGAIYYDYGGLFSAWLQQTYGMEKYAELWQAIGRFPGVSFSVYRSGYYRIFKNVYGLDFTAAWEAFRNSLALSGLEENPDELLPAKAHFFSENRNFIAALAGRGNDVYVLDSTERKVRVYDTTTGNLRAFNTRSLRPYSLDVSADATTLLVSGYHLTGDRYRAVVTEYRTDSGRRTGREIRGLYRTRYFRNGVIGIRSELHNTCIVYEDFNGYSETLFRGNAELIFSGPQPVDNERIAFVAARNGARELLLYNYVSGELFRIESSAADIEVCHNGGCYNDDCQCRLWRYMRNLGVSEGRLFFSHNSDDRMYKLASIDLETMQAVFSGRDFSGGVFHPVSVGGEVYYRGAFMSGDGLLRFPETVASISGTQIDVRLVSVNTEDYGRHTRRNTEEVAAWPEASKPYFSLRYMNPFGFWLPLPLLRYNPSNDNMNVSLDGGGLLSVIMDPTDRHFIMTVAYADVVNRMAMVDSFHWQTTVPGFPLTLEFSDKVLYSSGTEPYRDTWVNLTGNFRRSPGSWSYGFSLGGGYRRIAHYDGGESAYEWKETRSNFSYNIGFTFSNIIRRQHELFGTGLSINVRGISFLDDFEPRVEGVFRIRKETRFPISLAVYGAYDAREMNLHGVSRSYGQSLFSGAASTEYPHPRELSLNWIGGAEASLGLFSFEIQRNLSHAYFNRVFCALALRNVIYDGEGNPGVPGIEIGDIRLAQSLVLKMGMISSFVPLKVAPFFVEPNIWGAWRISNTITGQGFPWSFGMGVNVYL